MITDFTINLLYTQDRLQRFDYVLGEGGIILLEFTDEEYDDIQGGLELIANKHFIFFQDSNYHDLGFCVSFLLNTLKALGVYHGIADIDSNTQEVTLASLGRDPDILTFTVDDGFVKLSYEWKGGKSRNQFSFENITVDTQAWIDAAKTALGEYFEITERMFSLFEGMKKTSILYKILQDWKAFAEEGFEG